MSKTQNFPKLIFLAGPTAVGKTDLAIELAKNLEAEIVNADSIQCYELLQIGAAKPSAKQLEMVPHHLIGFWPLAQQLTVADFQRAALKVFSEAGSRGIKALVVVGGSGFYLGALQNGLTKLEPIPLEIRQQVERDLQEKGLPFLYEELRISDPDTSEKIHANDSYRILRSLEIIRTHKQPLSELKKQNQYDQPLEVQWLCCDRLRSELHERIELRTNQMLKDGLVGEVQSLINQGFQASPALQSIGYAEVLQFLEGKISSDELAQRITQKTRQLAKRQLTWFRHQVPQASWLDLSSPLPENLFSNLQP